MTMFLLLLRLAFALAGVLALMWVAAKILARGGLAGAGRDGSVQVLSRTALNRAACLALVQVGEEALLLGVTEQNVTVLQTRPAAELAAAAAQQPTRSRVGIPLQPGAKDGFTLTAARSGAGLIERLRARTERR